jgi:hypothetical protein
MVDFGKTDYFNAMDHPNERAQPMENLHISELGSSARIGDVLQSLKGEINTGTGHVELVFLGTGKGSLGQGNTNPEMFDRQKREEVRQLSKLNGVTLSTHAAIQKAGWSGFNAQANAFSFREANDSLNELKRTIDFAADAASGGAVVCHTSEFPRQVKDKRFKLGPEHEEVIHFANEDTGEIVRIQRGQELFVPEWKKNAQGQYIDIDGNPIGDPDEFLARVPEYNMDDGSVPFSKLTYDDVEKEVNQWNNKNPNKRRNADKVFLKMVQRENWEKSYAMGQSYRQAYKRTQEQIKELQAQHDDWKYYERSVKDPAKLKMLRDRWLAEQQQRYGGNKRYFLEPGESPTDYYRKELEDMKRSAIREKEGYFGYQKDLEKMERMYEKIKPIEEVGVKRSAQTFAQAAVYAYDIEQERKKKGKALDREIYIAPENMFAEWGYGGHPDDLKNLITKSREEMKVMLKKRGITGKKADDIAKSHIKATWDVGHANTWSKYFEQDSGRSPEENKKVFDKWMVGEVKKLVKEGIIGHVHMSDNFGYQDEHLNLGEGNVPINDFINGLKDEGYEGDLVVEWGAQGSDEPSGAMLAAWGNLAKSPIYRVDGQAAPNWRSIEHTGYFGSSSSPMMAVGRYATAMGRDWQLWTYSEAPIE